MSISQLQSCFWVTGSSRELVTCFDYWKLKYEHYLLQIYPKSYKSVIAFHRIKNDFGKNLQFRCQERSIILSLPISNVHPTNLIPFKPYLTFYSYSYNIHCYNIRCNSSNHRVPTTRTHHRESGRDEQVQMLSHWYIYIEASCLEIKHISYSLPLIYNFIIICE